MRRIYGIGETILSQRFRRIVGMDTDSKFLVNAFFEANSPTFTITEYKQYQTQVILPANMVQGANS
jgi:hypothetical protein